MKLSRDSLILWLPIVGALLTYLLNTSAPTSWTYNQWLQFAAAVVATVSAKLMTSPLSGSSDANTIKGGRP